MLAKIEMDLYKATKLLEINKMLTQSLQLNDILRNVKKRPCVRKNSTLFRQFTTIQTSTRV